MIFSILDIILLSVVCISTILGFWSGLLRSLIGVCSFVGAILLAFFLYPFTLDFLSDHMSNGLFLTFSAAILSYSASVVSCNVIKSVLNHSLFIISGGIIDRLLGIVFGVIRGFVIALLLFCTLIVFATGNYADAESANDLDIFNTKEPTWIYDSRSFIYFKEFSSALENRYPKIYEEIMSTKLPDLRYDTKDSEEEDNETNEQNGKGYNILKNIF